MGRPSGTVETKLSEEQVAEIVKSVDSSDFSEAIIKDIPELFQRVGKAGSTISRGFLETHEWILAPLLKASPVHTIHVDSCLCLCMPGLCRDSLNHFTQPRDDIKQSELSFILLMCFLSILSAAHNCGTKGFHDLAKASSSGRWNCAEAHCQW